MARMEVSNGRSDLRTHLATTRGGGSLLEIDAWIPSEISAITPLVERLMRLIEGSHCVTGEEHSVQLALREALNNAIVHGNRLDAHKLVHVCCRCKVGKGISLIARQPSGQLKSGSRLERGKTMKSQNLATKAKNLPTGVVRSDAPEANIKKVPTLDEIRGRALEIHIERSGHVCDMDNYLDEWLQAERELREKYNRSNDESAKEK